MEHKVFSMKFKDVYPCLITKAEKKGRTADEVFELTEWLFGYSREELEEMLKSDKSYGEFIDNIPKLNEKASLITGKVCGVDVAAIEDHKMRMLRYLDKIVDELAKGKSMEKIKREAK